MQHLFTRKLEAIENPVEVIRSIIDHTNLKPEASVGELEKTCRETVEHGFYACCIPPFFVRKAKSITGGKARVATVIGFPHGNHSPEVKEYETRKAYEDGADEVDAVINISLIRSGRMVEAIDEVKRLLEVTREYGGVLKVIIETGFLENKTIFEVSRNLAQIGVHFVKTSTGFGPRVATPEDVLIMREAVKGTGTRVKAAGGIRTGLQALYFYLIGADRIGTSSSIQIISDLQFLSTINV
ncbi:MAG: deoxyribose-phosphate aldolase [Infirmifilum sp.]